MEQDREVRGDVVVHLAPYVDWLQTRIPAPTAVETWIQLRYVSRPRLLGPSFSSRGLNRRFAPSTAGP
jgi:hypothetical protein